MKWPKVIERQAIIPAIANGLMLLSRVSRGFEEPRADC